MKVFYLLLFILSVGYAFDPLMKSGFTQLVRIKKKKDIILFNKWYANQKYVLYISFNM